MLSRIAESFYWLGRYVERAEATSRLLAEHHQLLVEDRSVPEVTGCSVLLSEDMNAGENVGGVRIVNPFRA